MTKGLQRSLGRGDQAALAALVTDETSDLVKVTISLTAVSIDSVTVAAAIGFGSVSLGNLPEGNIIMHGIVADLTFSGPTSADLTDTWDGDWGLGTTPIDDATISVGDEDIITENPMGAATAEVSPLQHEAAIPAGIIDNTAADLELNLNLLIDAAEQTDDTTVAIAVTGTVVYTYSLLGDD